MCSRNKKSESGQSTIEFALTMVLISGFMFMFFQLSMVMGFSSYIQYATFMAARAYLAAGPDMQDQRNRATTVIQQMLKISGTGQDRLPTIAKGEGGGEGGGKGLSFTIPQFDPKAKNYSWLQGIRYDFKGRVLLLPLGKGAATKPGAASISLTSESYLGRETPTDACQAEMQNRGGGIYDNGC